MTFFRLLVSAVLAAGAPALAQTPLITPPQVQAPAQAPAQARLQPPPPAAAPASLPRLPGSDVLPERGVARDRTAVDPDFRLGPGDVLRVNVLEDPSLDSDVLIRPDGRISIPLAGSLVASGRTPEQLAADIRRALGPSFIEPPTVNVTLRALATEEPPDLLTIYVVGEVNNPGGFQIEEPIGLIQALSLAGGLSIFAADERIQVRQLTPQGVEQVLLVDYEAIEEGAAAPRLVLGDGDTIVVPERGLFE